MPAWPVPREVAAAPHAEEAEAAAPPAGEEVVAVPPAGEAVVAVPHAEEAEAAVPPAEEEEAVRYAAVVQVAAGFAAVATGFVLVAFPADLKMQNCHLQMALVRLTLVATFQRSFYSAE